MVTRNRRSLLRSSAAALTASAALVLGGCGGTAGPETGVDVEDIQNDLPTAGGFEDFSGAQNFAGQQVTVSAEIDEIIGPNGFIIADDAGEPLLVIYDGTPQLTVDTPVKVTGTVKRAFAIYEAEEFASGGFNDTAFSDFNGEPYIQASNVDTLTEHGN